MQNQTVVVTAVIGVQKGREGEAENLMRSLIPPTRDETGCVSYNLHCLSDDRSVFMFHETWASRKALDEHLATPHLTGFLKKIGPFLSQPPDIRIWKKID